MEKEKIILETLNYCTKICTKHGNSCHLILIDKTCRAYCLLLLYIFSYVIWYNFDIQFHILDITQKKNTKFSARFASKFQSQ